MQFGTFSFYFIRKALIGCLTHPQNEIILPTVVRFPFRFNALETALSGLVVMIVDVPAKWANRDCSYVTLSQLLKLLTETCLGTLLGHTASDNAQSRKFERLLHADYLGNKDHRWCAQTLSVLRHNHRASMRSIMSGTSVTWLQV